MSTVRNHDTENKIVEMMRRLNTLEDKVSTLETAKPEFVINLNDGEFGRIAKTETTITITEEREEEMKPEEIKPEIYTLHNKDDLKKITFAALLKVSDAIQNRCSPEEMPGLVFSLNSLVQRLLDF